VEKQRILGIDYGSTKYGLAVTSTGTNYISPLPPLKATKGSVKAYALDEIIVSYGITHIVIGWPEDLLGIKPKCGDLIIDLVKFIKSRQPFCQVELINEKYTSREAKRQIQGRSRDSVDSLSACIILQDFLSTQALDNAGRTHELKH
jgi:putative Holliday junction resolvase